MNTKETGKKAARVALRLVWPGAAIKKTIQNTKKLQEQHERNITHIKEMFQEVRNNTKSEPPKEARKDLSFEETMSRREPGSPSIPALYDHFLLKKRLALTVGAAFIAMAIYALANGTWLGLAPLLGSPPVFFMIALSAQLRLWQLRTRRLSQAEKGGLPDFIKETRGWWWVVLDPEFSRAKGAQP
jgi:hypothetical protein